MEQSASDVGEAFALALSRGDFDAAGAALHPEVEFRALTPRRAWSPEGHAEAVEVLRTWFGDCEIADVDVEHGAVGDRRRVAYRFRGHRAEGPFVLEQQAYFTERDGRIDWLRIVCSGFCSPGEA